MDLVLPKKPLTHEYVASAPMVVSEKLRLKLGLFGCFGGGRPQPSITTKIKHKNRYTSNHCTIASFD